MPRHALRAAVPAILVLAATACRSGTGLDAGLAPGERLVTLEVAPARAPCVGEGRHECLQVRTEAGAPWSLFYEPIAGFVHEPGYRYTLRVARRAVPNPPADGSSAAYRLVAVVSRVVAAPT